MNQETLQLHRASTREELLDGLERTFTERSLVDFREELIELFNGVQTATREAEVKTLDGEQRDVLVRVSVDPRHPDWSLVMVVLVDITERKQAERKLRVNESLLTVTARVGQIAGWSMEAETGAMSWTDEVFRIFGMETGAVPSFARRYRMLSACGPRGIERCGQVLPRSGSPLRFGVAFR